MISWDIFSFLILFNGHKRMNPSFPGSCVFWVSVPRQILWWAGDQSGSGHTHGFIQSCSTEQEVLRFPRSRFSTRRPFAASSEIVQRVDWRFATDAIRNLFIKQTRTFSPPLSRARTHTPSLPSLLTSKKVIVPVEFIYFSFHRQIPQQILISLSLLLWYTCSHHSFPFTLKVWRLLTEINHGLALLITEDIWTWLFLIVQHNDVC